MRTNSSGSLAKHPFEKPQDEFPVVAACDDQFAEHTSVMLRSLIENNPETPFKIILLVSQGLDPTVENMIVKSMPDARQTLAFIKISTTNLTALKISEWITHAAYYRLMVADLLPHVSRALYLDSDIIVTGDISDLLRVDISNYPLAAALDVYDSRPDFKQRLNLDLSTHYFNSGVMLLNLDKWRSENIGQRAIEFAEANPERIVYWDQCALNSIICGNFLVLSKKWNFQRADVDFDLEQNRSMERARDAKILHFTTGDKPWHFMCGHPLKLLYWEYLAKTGWSDYVEPNATFKHAVLKKLRTNYPVLSRGIEESIRSMRNCSAWLAGC